MSDEREPTSTADAQLSAVEDALHKVQAQAAALEGLSEELALSVHVLEGEIARLKARPARPSGPIPADPHDTPFVPPTRSTDAEGARLVALNMALNGDPREATGRYIEQHFELADREGLLDEVYTVAGC